MIITDKRGAYVIFEKLKIMSDKNFLGRKFYDRVKMEYEYTYTY